jgi:trans-2,3-dihydro-3-hydroxyanthranilate isomerase
MQVEFHLVDVFAEQPLTGNPLAIVPDAGSLDDSVMRNVARELQQAETTFLLRPSRAGADWRLRSFTADGTEVFGAGHNSLGAWWWLAETGRLNLAEGQTILTQEIGDRLLPVRLDVVDQCLQWVTLTQTPPAYSEVCEDLMALAVALGLQHSDFEARLLPAQTVSTGASHLLVPVRNRGVVERASPDAPRLVQVLHQAGAQGCYLFSLDPKSPKAVAHARFFNPAVGLFEDSATGSAAGPLACFLIARGVAQQGNTLTIEQGCEMARPSLLRVYVSGDLVQLSGRCVHVAQGTLRVR